MASRSPYSLEEYRFEVSAYRRGMSVPLKRPVKSTNVEVYHETYSLYLEIIKKVAGKQLDSSFAITGLPRAMAINAMAEFYFLLWEDLEAQYEEFGQDFFQVFNYRQSWVNFF